MTGRKNYLILSSVILCLGYRNAPSVGAVWCLQGKRYDEYDGAHIDALQDTLEFSESAGKKGA